MKQTPISCVIVSVEVDMRPIDNNTVNRLLSDIVGNPDSFTRLFNEMNVPMYMVAFRILRNRADAEDAVQDAFLKLLKNEPTAVANARAYIFQTVRNTAISRLRRRNFETSTDPEELLPLLERLRQYRNLKIRGLMTVAPMVDDAEQNRAVFRRLRELSIDIKLKNADNVTMNVLSMGMTGDYRVAIEEGATMVRVGTGIFGMRQIGE